MRKFFIRKGKHSSGLHFGLYFGQKEFCRTFRFDKSCLYPVVSGDDFDINKLFGFSYLTFSKYPPHHYNSIRVGWRPSKKHPEQIELYFYLYNKGKRIIFDFYNVATDKNFKLTIGTNFQAVAMFQLENSEKVLAKVFVPYIYPKFRWGYLLYPFFGGDNPAPHDMFVRIGKS